MQRKILLTTEFSGRGRVCVLRVTSDLTEGRWSKKLNWALLSLTLKDTLKRWMSGRKSLERQITQHALQRLVPGGVWSCTPLPCACVLPALRVSDGRSSSRKRRRKVTCRQQRPVCVQDLVGVPSVRLFYRSVTCRWPPGRPGCVWCRGSALPGRLWAAWSDPAPRSGPSRCTCPAGGGKIRKK